MKSFIKKVFLVVSLFCLSETLYAQKYCCYYDGYWGEWRSWPNYWSYLSPADDISFHGGYGGFSVYRRWEHPSEYFFKFQISGYTKPTKKEIKQHYKKKEWWVYNGTVEYYVCDVYPTLGDCLKKLHKLLEEADVKKDGYEKKLSLMKAEQISRTGRFNGIGYQKVSKSATIKIAPYKDRPRVYNIWVDGVGYAIDLENHYWN